MPRYLPLSLLCLAALLLAGCSGVFSPPTPTPPNPREIAAAVGRSTQASQSVHFTIELGGKPVLADTAGLTVLNRVEGDLRRPDGVLAVLNVTIGGAIAEIRTVSLAGQQYITNPITRQWGCLAPNTAFDPAVLFAPESGVEHLLQEGFAEISLLGTEDVDGRPHYRLRGSIPGERLRPISLGLLGAGPVAAELWADVETMRATRLVLTDTATDPATPSTWTMSFRDYDKAVDVRAPVQC